jgi:hypothetical protein
MNRLFALILLIATSASASDFVPLKRREVPAEAIEALCIPRIKNYDCLQDFRNNGKAYEVDANDDGTKEILIHLGLGDTGSGGEEYELVQKQGNKWVGISGEEGWLIYNGLCLGKLGSSRMGYHDLRIGRTLFVKWNGRRYVRFNEKDLRALPAVLFDVNDPEDAEILWLIRYADQTEIKLEPNWFPAPKNSRIFAGPVAASVEGLNWLSLYKGSVWCLRDKKAFLVLPRATYLGATDLQVAGDWLVVFGDPWSHTGCNGKKSHIEIARYQWSTHTLKISPCAQIPFESN